MKGESRKKGKERGEDTVEEGVRGSGPEERRHPW